MLTGQPEANRHDLRSNQPDNRTFSTMKEEIMKFVRYLLIAALLGALSGAAAAAEETPSADERWQALDQKIRILERRLELDQEQAAAKGKDAVVVGAGEKGFFLKSANGDYQLKLSGYVQLDGRFYLDDDNHAASDTFTLRRVRPIVEGTLAKHFDFRIMPDFGGGKTVLQDAYLNARYWPAAKIQVGKFKAPFGLERLQSGTATLFVERALPTSLVPNRDLGLQLHGEVGEGMLTYALGVFNGVPDGGSGDEDSNDGKDVIGRIFVHPFRKTNIDLLKGFGIGVAASSGNAEGSLSSPDLPSFKTSGQKTFFSYRTNSPATASGTVIADGRRNRLSPQAYYFAGPFGLLGEYVRTNQEVEKGTSDEKLTHKAWQVSSSWVLTGEDASFKGVKPKHPFDPAAGNWGALEVAGRYHQLKVDQDAFPIFADATKSAEKATAWGVGLNWYLNSNVKAVINYEETDFDGGAASNGDRPNEKLILSRFQVAF